MQSLPAIWSRLAPTPSGFLHVGNAFSFVLTWLLVQYYQGKLLLRIDDMDADRKRPTFVADIFETLHWLGLEWDAGPNDIEDFEGNFSQLHYLPVYARLLERLKQQGLLYACNCSRAQIQATAPGGIYPGTCRHRHLPLDAPDVAWRVHVPEHTTVTIGELTGTTESVRLDLTMGDFVVRRKNGLPAYQIASLADDMRYGINLIVRGADLLASTAAQLFLAQQLQLEAFQSVRFYHHPLLKNKQGEKLSKSAGATSLQTLRQQWASPAPLYQAIAKTLHLPDGPVKKPADLLTNFTPSHLPNKAEVTIIPS